MLDDPRIKRVIKRFPKGDQFSDASMDVSSFGDADLLAACRRQDVNEFSRPIELDDYALSRLAQRMGNVFDREQFDYFPHSYIRAEHREDYYNDPTTTFFPAPEDGPPSNIPLEKGLRWFAVRP